MRLNYNQVDFPAWTAFAARVDFYAERAARVARVWDEKINQHLLKFDGADRFV